MMGIEDTNEMPTKKALPQEEPSAPFCEPDLRRKWDKYDS